jgi:ABC-type polar amino acid transport system ATPase subunit
MGTTMLLATHNTEFAVQAARTFALIQEETLQVSRDPALLENLREQRK